MVTWAPRVGVILSVAAIAAVVADRAPLDAPPVAAAELRVADPVCSPSGLPDGAFFAAEPGGVRGADYQRATPLPDGSVLWTFQDAEVRRTDGSSTLVHNIGMLQRGACFSVLMGGTADAPAPWLMAADTTPFRHWYWPLGAEVGNDGRVHVFLAEMFERGPGYLVLVEPTSTIVAVVDGGTGRVERYQRPADSSAALYGWSIESDERWTYLYAQCHRQFGYDPYIFSYAHDQACSSRVTVGRVPRGDLFGPIAYWTGGGWSSNPGAAAPVFDMAGRMVNATQVVRSGVSWMAITKVGDWWGDRILVERADRPTGPFRVVADLLSVPKCPVDCNTYFTSWVPSGDPSVLVYGLSHNRWDGVFSDVYRPSFAAFPAPTEVLAPADRCGLGHCD